MNKRKALGKDLSALLGDLAVTDGIADTAEHSGEGIADIDIRKISRAARQSRQVFDADKIAELADSIRVSGLLQPIIVRPKPGGEDEYELVAGERRWRAAQGGRLNQCAEYCPQDGRQSGGGAGAYGKCPARGSGSLRAGSRTQRIDDNILLHPTSIGRAVGDAAGEHRQSFKIVELGTRRPATSARRSFGPGACQGHFEFAAAGLKNRRRLLSTPKS